jgi:hypothetical protein
MQEKTEKRALDLQFSSIWPIQLEAKIENLGTKSKLKLS